jgi:hypothetical protein
VRCGDRNRDESKIAHLTSLIPHLEPGCFMNCRHETVEMACHLAPAGTRTRGVLDSTSQGAWPEDARKDAYFRGRSRPFMKYSG